MPDITRNISEALTFDDVLLKPAASSVLPSDADTETAYPPDIPSYSSDIGGDGYGNGKPAGHYHGTEWRDWYYP